jgi:hypothetical protein
MRIPATAARYPAPGAVPAQTSADHAENPDHAKNVEAQPLSGTLSRRITHGGQP